MVEVSYAHLHELMDKGLTARNYACDHYEELATRAASETLYGPVTNFLGAASPSHLIPLRERKLSKKTKRDKYTKYEFGSDGSLIRITYVYSGEEVYCVYHVFMLDGVIYGCPFTNPDRHFVEDRIEAVQFYNGNPYCYYQTTKTKIFCEFYEYPPEGKRICTGYFYNKNCQTTVHGCQPNWDAPIGEPESPVVKHCYEDGMASFVFSKFFPAEKVETDVNFVNPEM